MIYEYFKVCDTDESVLDLDEKLRVKLMSQYLSSVSESMKGLKRAAKGSQYQLMRPSTGRKQD